MQKTIQEWIEIADYDLQTAEVMLKGERYLYVAFMCQQSAEKTLKAIYVYKKNVLPPRTHNLLYLVDILGISLEKPRLELLSRLNLFYLESRYPGERNNLAKALDKDKAQDILSKSKEVIKCLKQMLP